MYIEENLQGDKWSHTWIHIPPVSTEVSAQSEGAMKTGSSPAWIPH